MKKVAVAVLIILVILFVFSLRKKTTVFQNDNNKVVSNNLPAINGVMVNEVVAKARPIAVMVENHPDARPQSGLTDADLVYEAPTEAGITRFMAVFQTNLAKNIGPIRSARVYFAEIANELDAVYAHVGGNSDALANIKAGVYKNISDADQFFNDAFFHRIKARPMPHNVYTSVEQLENLVKEKSYSNRASFNPWQFKDDMPSSTSSASQINIDFSTSSYEVKWQYNKTENNYLRWLAGLPHKDADTGKQIQAKNVIVQFVETAPSKTDTVLSININLTAGGKAIIFLDGKAVEGTWKKMADDRTRYYNNAGQEIDFNRGTTWVELVPVEKQGYLNWH